MIRGTLAKYIHHCPISRIHSGFIIDNYVFYYKHLNGKVVARFWCDKVEEFYEEGNHFNDTEYEDCGITFDILDSFG